MTRDEARDGEGKVKPARGRNAAIVPPIAVDFDTALGALLKTPPPEKVPMTTAPKKKTAKKTGKPR